MNESLRALIRDVTAATGEFERARPYRYVPGGRAERERRKRITRTTLAFVMAAAVLAIGTGLGVFFLAPRVGRVTETVTRVVQSCPPGARKPPARPSHPASPARPALPPKPTLPATAERG